MGIELLFLLFLTLKLTGVITWSWWAVTAPLWIAGAIYTLWALIVAGTCALVWWADKK